ncbi:MAG: hypothetical protein GXP47_04565, partial [Acidobacteria bacterium]|nr:hypothetical protein [Acidobacteriota bacterium]
RALAELLLRGADAPAAAWIESAGPETIPGGPRLAGLVLRTVGAATIRDAAALDVEAACAGGRFLPLPVVDRVEEHQGALRRRRRSMARPAVAAIVEAAEELRRFLDRRPGSGDAAAFAGWFAGLFRQLGLAGEPVTDAEDAVREILAALETSGEVRWEALAPVVADRLARLAAAPAGGQGGGVALLGVTEARGRTFDHLFLAGLERGVFPFRRPEDPLLPEIVRQQLSVVLAEIPLAARSPLEERYLFAQLLSSAKAVTLSWAATDHDGRATNPSAFLERLSLEGRLDAALRGEDCPLVADVFDPDRGGSVRPGIEHLVAAGLRGARGTVASMLEAVAGPAGGHAARVLDLLDPPDRPAPVLGPFDGAVGRAPSGELWVTRLEAVSRCPFQAFLERDLGIEPPPEAGAGLDRLGGALLGSVVHAILEALVREHGLPSDVELDVARRHDPRRVKWPESSKLEELAIREARRVAAREGRPALALALARRALGFLERAREIDWEGSGPRVLGAELRGAAEIPLGRETAMVRFRADRVDREEDGTLVLTDYKTGAVDNAVYASTRIRYARQGKLLQGGVYALAISGGAVGRYLSLKEGVAPEERTVELDGTAEHAAIATAVGLAVGEILACLDTGTMFPRLDGAGSPCDHCAVRLACLRDDSSYRRRIVDAMAVLEEDDPVRQLWEQRRATMPREGS